MTIIPLGSKLLVLPDKPKEVSQGGVIIPGSAVDSVNTGTITATGAEANISFERIGLHPDLVDTRVVYNKGAGTKVSDDGNILMDIADILAVIE